MQALARIMVEHFLRLHLTTRDAYPGMQETGKLSSILQ
jgi:hypothetical protein